MELFKTLGISLAIGLLIGFERSWSEKSSPKMHIAGLRTFALVGLLGGLSATISYEFTPWFLIVTLIAISVILFLLYNRDSEQNRYYGMTTIVALYVTFCLGILSVMGEALLAVGLAVLTGTLLGMKGRVKLWLENLDHSELFSVYKLLIISVVLLPLLPDENFGPWNVINLYEIWWLVVLITSISFVGYFAIKIKGTRIGILLTAFFGGLASSTVTTLNFSKIGSQNKHIHSLLTAGVIVSSATMFPRVILEVVVVHYPLAYSLIFPMLSMSLISYLLAYYFWKRKEKNTTKESIPLKNPFELLPALKFGILLTLILVLGKVFKMQFGDTGIYVLSFLSGISDVDAITLTLARMTRAGEITSNVATMAVVIAALTNTLVKALLVIFIARGFMGKSIAIAFSIIIATGVIAAILM
ncbi:MAG: MgtC/SapB family protein [Leptospirales bacterium]